MLTLAQITETITVQWSIHTWIAVVTAVITVVGAILRSTGKISKRIQAVEAVGKDTLAIVQAAIKRIDAHDKQLAKHARELRNRRARRKRKAAS